MRHNSSSCKKGFIDLYFTNQVHGDISEATKKGPQQILSVNKRSLRDGAGVLLYYRRINYRINHK